MFTRFIVGGLSLALGLALGAAARADQPKAGAAKKLAEVFQDLDANHDGVLDQAEVDAPSKPAFKTSSRKATRTRTARSTPRNSTRSARR